MFLQVTPLYGGRYRHRQEGIKKHSENIKKWGYKEGTRMKSVRQSLEDTKWIWFRHLVRMGEET